MYHLILCGILKKQIIWPKTWQSKKVKLVSSRKTIIPNWYFEFEKTWQTYDIFLNYLMCPNEENCDEARKMTCAPFPPFPPSGPANSVAKILAKLMFPLPPFPP